MATHTSTPAATAAQPSAVTPEPILRLASGFMAAKHLFAANELGLFEALADSPDHPRRAGGPHRLDPPRGAHQRRRHGGARPARAGGRDATATAAVAAAFLAGRGPADLRPFLRFWDKISYPSLGRVGRGPRQGPVQGDLRARRRAAGGGLRRDRGHPGRPRRGPARGRRLLPPPAPARRRRRHRLLVDRRRPGVPPPRGHRLRAAHRRRRSPASASRRPVWPRASGWWPATP